MELAYKYPFIRKAVMMFSKYIMNPSFAKNGGVIAVDLEGNPIAHYYDPKLSLTSGIKIGNHIYCGSISYPFIISLDVNQYPATHST
ncbi:hypothetical protein AHAS_Ahas01G0080700 [Arachis hypogaea]